MTSLRLVGFRRWTHPKGPKLVKLSLPISTTSHIRPSPLSSTYRICVMSAYNSDITLVETKAYIMLPDCSEFEVPIRSSRMSFDEVTEWMKDLRKEFGPSCSLLLRRKTGQHILVYENFLRNNVSALFQSLRLLARVRSVMVMSVLSRPDKEEATVSFCFSYTIRHIC